MSLIKIEWTNKTNEDPYKKIHREGIVVYHNKRKEIIHCHPSYTYFKISKKGIETDLHYSSFTENYVEDFDLWTKFSVNDYINHIVNKPFDVLYDLNMDTNSYFSLVPLDVIKIIILML